MLRCNKNKMRSEFPSNPVPEHIHPTLPHDRVGESSEANKSQKLAYRINPRGFAALDLGTNRAASTMAAIPNRQVDPKDRTPTDELGQRSVQERPDRKGQASHLLPKPDGLRPSLWFLKRICDNRAFFMSFFALFRTGAAFARGESLPMPLILA